MRSIVNKVTDFNLFVDTFDPDLVALTETWLHADLPNSLFVNTDKYCVFRKDRCTRGGGVCILIKRMRKLIATEVILPTEYQKLEIVAIDIYDKLSKPMRIVCVYRPPDYCADDNVLLFSALKHLADNSARICFLGDFNLPDFNWIHLVYPDNVLYNATADFICNQGLSQIVMQTTRGDSILDLVLTSDPICCDSVQYIAPLANSDHCIVTWQLALTLPSDADECTETCYNFSNADWDAICAYLSTVNWLAVSEAYNTASLMWGRFVEIVTAGFELYVPKTVRVKRKASRPYYPKSVRTLQSKKLECWRLLRNFRTPKLAAKYAALTQKCSDAIQNFHLHLENRLIEKGNLGNFYKYANKKLNGSNGIAPLRDKDGRIVNSNSEKASLLNEYFSSVFTRDNGVIDDARLPQRVEQQMAAVFFTPEAVQKSIRGLKSNSSAGPDGLPAVFFKNAASLICFPLSVIFNLSLQTGDLPVIWKNASVTPVFKKGSPSDPSNYRPISLTCIACKLMECTIKDGLLLHLKQHGLIDRNQYGFLSRKSTTSHLLDCTLDWNLALNAKHNVDVVYLDFAKAFDSVVHNKLLAKLKCYGVNNMLLSWIEAYLVGRSQFVRIEGSVSSTCSVISGVPQGSVLGPILFLIFINDISTCVSQNVTTKLFADDTKLYSILHDSSSCNSLQKSLDSISGWSDHWQLKLSPTKCTVMRIKAAHTTCSAPSYHIGSVSLPVIVMCNDLGVSYDSCLNFKSHIDKIVSKASCRAKLILKCFVTRDAHVLMSAFSVFVRPLLEYSSVIWSPFTKTEIGRIESVQRRFTKCIQSIKSCSYRERLIKLGIDSLYCRRLKFDLIMCYKILNNLIDIDSSRYFTAPTYSATRKNHQYKLFKSRVVSCRDANFFTNRVIDLWNSLPCLVVCAPSVSCFKKRLNSFSFADFDFDRP